MPHPLRIAFILACLLTTSLLASCERKVDWSETVTLRDGRTVLVRRAAWLGDQWLNLKAKWPHSYAIRFENPETHEHFSWSGKYGIAPVMIDFAGRETYLVIAPFLCNADMSDYGNPNPPFVYMRYQGLLRGWKAVPLAEFPGVHRANLTPGGEHVTDGEYFPKSDVIDRIRGAEQSTHGFFQAEIPATLEAWRYEYKKPGPYTKC